MSPKKLSSKTKNTEAEVAAEKARLQANFLTQTKAPKGTEQEKKDKQEVYNLYTSLARKDPEKALLLQKWSQDKSCKWSNSYSKERLFKTATIESSVQGYGTKSDTQFNWFGLVLFFCFTTTNKQHQTAFNSKV